MSFFPSPEVAPIPGLAGRQFPSAVGRHVLVSKRTGDDRVGTKYTLTVYSRATKEPEGSFKSHLPSLPILFR
jgi:hypothetical protein